MAEDSTDTSPLANLLSPEQRAQLGGKLGKLDPEQPAPLADVVYAMLDDGQHAKPQNQGFSEAVAKFEQQYSDAALAGLSAITYTDGPQLSLVAKNDDIVTDRDVEPTISQVMAMCMTGDVSLSEMNSIIDRVKKCVGTRGSLDDVRRDALADAERAVQGAAAERAETTGQKIERLRAEIKAIDESLDEEYKRAVAKGAMSQKTYDDILEKRKYAEAHPDDANAQKESQDSAEKGVSEMEKNATTPDDIESAKKARKGIDKRGDVVKKLQSNIEAIQTARTTQKTWDEQKNKKVSKDLETGNYYDVNAPDAFTERMNKINNNDLENVVKNQLLSQNRLAMDTKPDVSEIKTQLVNVAKLASKEIDLG